MLSLLLHNLSFSSPRSRDDDSAGDCITHEVKVYTCNNNNNNNQKKKNNNNNLFNVKHNISSYSKNYSIANKFRKNLKWQIYCFDYKTALQPFTCNSGAIFPRIDYGATVKLERTCLHWRGTLSKFNTDIYHSGNFSFCS